MKRHPAGALALTEMPKALTVRWYGAYLKEVPLRDA